LREKIVARASEDFVVVVDGSKMVGSLGRGPLPVEIEPFGWEVTLRSLASLGCEPELRMDQEDPERPYVTEGGHYTADCRFPSIADPDALEGEIKGIPGALECGLFVGLAREVVVGRSGGTEVLRDE